MIEKARKKSTMKPAPFKVGDRVEYIGNRLVTTEVEGKQVLVIGKGMVATIAETHPPVKGLGFIKNDEDGEPIIDRDTDGHNVYVNQFGQRRIIWPDKSFDWKLTVF